MTVPKVWSPRCFSLPSLSKWLRLWMPRMSRPWWVRHQRRRRRPGWRHVVASRPMTVTCRIISRTKFWGIKQCRCMEILKNFSSVFVYIFGTKLQVANIFGTELPNLTNIFQMGWSHQLGIYRHNTNDLYCQRGLCTGFPWKLPEFDLVYYLIAKFTQKLPPFFIILVSISIDQLCYHVTTSSIISHSLCSGQNRQFKLPKWWISGCTPRCLQEIRP